MPIRPWDRARRAALTALGLALVQASAALAQSPAERRIVVGVNAGFQIVKDAFSQHVPVQLHRELGRFAASYDARSGFGYDGSAAIRIVGPLAAGVEWATFRSLSSADFDAALPHPEFWGVSRRFQGSIGDVTRRQRAFHLQAQYWREFLDGVLVRVFGGPTLFRLRHDLVTGVDIADGGAADDVQLAGYRVDTHSRGDFGFHFGFDVSYFGLQRLPYVGRFLGRYDVVERLALALVVRHGVGSSPRLIGDEQLHPNFDIGGTKIGAGLRMAF